MVAFKQGDFSFAWPLTLSDIPTSRLLQMDSAWAGFMFAKEHIQCDSLYIKFKNRQTLFPKYLQNTCAWLNYKGKQEGGRKVSWGGGYTKDITHVSNVRFLGWVAGPWCSILLLFIVMHIHYIHMNYITSKILNMRCVIIKSLFWVKKTCKCWFVLCIAFLSLRFALLFNALPLYCLR